MYWWWNMFVSSTSRQIIPNNYSMKTLNGVESLFTCGASLGFFPTAPPEKWLFTPLLQCCCGGLIMVLMTMAVVMVIQILHLYSPCHLCHPLHLLYSSRNQNHILTVSVSSFSGRRFMMMVRWNESIHNSSVTNPTQLW
jgi:hypothetical protein